MLNLRFYVRLLVPPYWCKYLPTAQSRHCYSSAEKMDSLVIALHSQNQPIFQHATSTIT